MLSSKSARIGTYVQGMIIAYSRSKFGPTYRKTHSDSTIQKEDSNYAKTRDKENQISFYLSNLTAHMNN